MPSLHTVGAAEGCSFHMHFHLGTNPHQRVPEIIGEPLFFFMVGGVCKLDPIAWSYVGRIADYIVLYVFFFFFKASFKWLQTNKTNKMIR